MATVTTSNSLSETPKRQAAKNCRLPLQAFGASDGRDERAADKHVGLCAGCNNDRQSDFNENVASRAIAEKAWVTMTLSDITSGGGSPLGAASTPIKASSIPAPTTGSLPSTAFNAHLAYDNFLEYLTRKLAADAAACLTWNLECDQTTIVSKTATVENAKLENASNLLRDCKQKFNQAACFELHAGIWALPIETKNPTTLAALLVFGKSLSPWMEEGANVMFLSQFLQSLLIHCAVDASEPAKTQQRSTEETKSIASQIVHLFENTLLKRWTKRPDDDQWETTGSKRCLAKVEHYVALSKPVLFVLPAFPFKSTNLVTKCIDERADMGEKLALTNLEAFVASIEAIYPPGARLVIFSDGRVYCDLLRVSDETTSKFRAAIRTLAPKSGRLCWSDLDVFLPYLSHDQKRAALESLFGTTPENLELEMHTNSDFMELYWGFKNCLIEEFRPRFPKEWGKNRIAKVVAPIAKRMVLRNWCYGVMVRCLFADHIRLSIHPSSNTLKFGVNLVGKSDWGTPWHNCALRRADGKWEMIRRAKAEEDGHKLTETAEGLCYFIETVAEC